MLAVVEHEQSAPVRDLLDDVLEPGATARQLDPDRLGERAGHVRVEADRRQLAPPAAAGEVELAGQLERETALAGAAGAQDRHQPAVGQQAGGALGLVLAADEAAGGSRHRRAGSALADGVVEDPVLERARVGVGGQAELGEPAGQRAQRFERLDLAAGAVEGEREDARHLLLERLRLDKAMQVVERLLVSALGHQRACAPDPRAHGQRLEAQDLGLRGGVVDQVLERRAPQLERLLVLALLDELLEAVGVDLAGVDRQAVGRAVADEQRRRRAARTLGLEERAQARQADRQRARRGVARVARPGRLDQLVGRHRPPGIEQQPRQHRALLAGPRRMRLPVVNHLQ